MTVLSSSLLHEDIVGGGDAAVLVVEPSEILINNTEQLEQEEALFSCIEVSYATAFACTCAWLHPCIAQIFA